MKLRNKINLYTTVMFICLLILITSAIYLSFSRMMQNSELERTAAEARQAISGINDSGASGPSKELLKAYVPVNGMLLIVKEDGSKGPAAVAPGQQGLYDLQAAFYQNEQQRIVEYNGVPHAFVSIPVVLNDGEVASLQVTESLEQTEKVLRTLRAVLVAVTVIAMIPVVISSRLLGNLITRPITSMIATMRDIQGSGHFKRIPLPRESKDELYQMGDTFNKMMELLEINYEKQGQFISNASHELKTPLTVIESYASLLKRRGREQPELFEESVQAIHSEAIRMKELTEQLLLLARHDEQWKVEWEELNLAGVVDELVRSFRKAYHRDIDLEAEEEVRIRTDVQKFRQLFYILMDNARKYSEDTIEVKVTKTPRYGVVEVLDRGIGIPAADLDKIFDRFYRVDKARTRKTGGFGLGLSLAKEIADAMAAKIQMESIEGYGTKAKILLPLSNQKDRDGISSKAT